ncbi:MAG: DUF721 domain-containing protein [Gemmatimonadota bacterium]
MSDAKRVGDVLQGILRQSGLKETLDRQGILDEWDGLVGSAISQVTRARNVAGTTLVVEVRSSAWLMELDMMKPQILDRLNQGRSEGRVERLVFVLAPDS